MPDNNANFYPLQGLLESIRKYLPAQQPPPPGIPGQMLGNPTRPSSIGVQPEVNPWVVNTSRSPATAGLSGAGGNLTPGLSTTPPISSTRVAPVPTQNADTPSQRQGDWASAASLLPPVGSSTNSPVDPFSRNLSASAFAQPPVAPKMGLNPHMGFTTPEDAATLQEKWKQSNMQSALSSLANLDSPSNYTKLLGGRS
jgi:hypothetical protein